MRHKAKGVSIAIAVLALLGCQRDAATTEDARTEHVRAEGQVVGMVNDDPITIGEVEQLVHEGKLSPKEALKRLEAERLLMAEAERRSVRGPEIDQVAQRASVQALLKREADAVVVSDEEVRELYAKDPRFHMPERRAALHVLARVPKKNPTPEQIETARKLAVEALKPLATREPDAVIEAYKGRRIDGIDMKAERIPLMGREDGLAQEFAAAMFSLSAPGMVPEVVRTSFGWHAIRVLEIDPAKDFPYDQVVEPLRQEIALRKRTERIEELLTELRRERLPKLDPELDRKLAKLAEEP